MGPHERQSFVWMCPGKRGPLRYNVRTVSLWFRLSSLGPWREGPPGGQHALVLTEEHPHNHTD